LPGALNQNGSSPGSAGRQQKVDISGVDAPSPSTDSNGEPPGTQRVIALMDGLKADAPDHCSVM